MKSDFHPAARAEHLKQAAYYESQAPGLGARYQSAVREAVDALREFPLAHPVVCEPGVRRLSVKKFPFTVYDLVNGDLLYILAIAPHRKAPGYWRGRT